MRMHRWNRDTLGTTRWPLVNSLAVVRSGRSWSVARCELTRSGRAIGDCGFFNLVNVSDHRTVREARAAVAAMLAAGEQA